MQTHLGNKVAEAERLFVKIVVVNHWTIQRAVLTKSKIILKPQWVRGENNKILFLWTIDKYLFEAQHIAESLGFKLHARMIWDKVTGIPAAFTVRYGHEYLLYMYKGKLIPVAKEERGKIHTVFREKVTKHSKKPEIAYEIIERLYPDLKKLEMYARNERNGWDSWGNEI
jgi:N6-adenosine-specific RNA methylase IME4